MKTADELGRGLAHKNLKMFLRTIKNRNSEEIAITASSLIGNFTGMMMATILKGLNEEQCKEVMNTQSAINDLNISRYLSLFGEKE